jgi:tetratricopeptide (TPR) repeat protein
MARLAVVGVLAVLSTLPVGLAVAQPGRSVDAWIARADALAAAGRRRPALALLRRAVARDPADPRAPLRLATLLLPAEPAAAAAPGSAERETAVEVSAMLAHTLAAAPDGEATAELRLAQAWADAVAGDHRDGIEGAGAAAGLLDTHAAALLRRLAALAVHRHDLVAADRALELARRADAADVSLLADHATVRLARGLPAGAAAILRDALERRPGDVDLRRALGAALLAAGDETGAITVLSRLARERPDDLRAQLELAQASLEIGDPVRAERAARQALPRSEASDARASVLLGLALAAQQRTAEARQAFQDALRRDPDDPRAREGLAALSGSGR